MPPRHADAIGYANELAKAVNEPWFNMICDLATIEQTSTLDDQSRETLLALLEMRASYIGIKAIYSSPISLRIHSKDFLEELSGFANFKLLGTNLHALFSKRVTLIFGANGSGKSSLCESLRVLANPEQPSRPLENVHATGVVSPSFSYKFTSDAIPQNWTPASGYGPRRSTVKYFDTAIAVEYLKKAVEPGRIIVLAPFKLHVFGWIKDLTNQLKAIVQRQKMALDTKRDVSLGAIATQFGSFSGHPLAALSPESIGDLAAEIVLGETFNEVDLLKSKLAQADDLERATSEAGLRLLKAERAELDKFCQSIGILTQKALEFWALRPHEKGIELAAKREAQELLAKHLLPDQGTLDDLLVFLRAASPLCSFEAPAGQVCPLCRQKLEPPELELFEQYSNLLLNSVEAEIDGLKSEIKMAKSLIEDVSKVNVLSTEDYPTLSSEMVNLAKLHSQAVIDGCTMTKGEKDDGQLALSSLNELCVDCAERSAQKTSAIEAAESGIEPLRDDLLKLRTEISQLEYAKSIADNLPKLREAQELGRQSVSWGDCLARFPQILKKVTDSSKDAYEELVVSDFEKFLDAEYKALTEKDMSSFGVVLARKGADASVTVHPQIGGKDIVRVLSEGEQRVHSLALFFAELETCLESVVVFDDPVSSFDFNYISNYCTRLRDFALNHPDSQIIVLTHNWDFFVQVQLTLKKAGLSNHLSTQVLENCSIVADYSDRLDELKAEIEAALVVPGEPSTQVKEDMAGKLRRLIEVVVNTYVFNNQRHQFRQRRQAVSEFDSYTKLVPLLPAEAKELSDLFAKLSIAEHDDPRSAYVNTDKATFQARYDRICSIGVALELRK